jgi:hypothetical protein
MAFTLALALPALRAAITLRSAAKHQRLRRLRPLQRVVRRHRRLVEQRPWIHGQAPCMLQHVRCRNGTTLRCLSERERGGRSHGDFLQCHSRSREMPVLRSARGFAPSRIRDRRQRRRSIVRDQVLQRPENREEILVTKNLPKNDFQKSSKAADF